MFQNICQLMDPVEDWPVLPVWFQCQMKIHLQWLEELSVMSFNRKYYFFWKMIEHTIFRERTNYGYCNHGILTVGLISEMVEIVGIIFPRPRPPKPMVLEIMFCRQNFIKTTVVHKYISNLACLCTGWKHQSTFNCWRY